MSFYVETVLKQLCLASGVGGQQEIADVARTLLQEYIDAIETDTMGNIMATLKSDVPNAPVLLLEAHMDEIGFMVTAHDEKGFLKVSPCGGVDCRCLAAAPVVVWGHTPLNGVFCSTPPHLQKEETKKALTSDALYIDVGLSYEVLKETVPIGTRVSFRKHFTTINDQCVCATSLDNRAGMAAILYALSQLQHKSLPCTVKVLFTVGEELGCRGAVAGAFSANADVAIVTDVSFALTPDAKPYQCGEMGKGAMLGISPTLSHSHTLALQSILENRHIAYQIEAVGGKTGTDADVIGISRGGVPTVLLSIPLRYMHTPVEMVNSKDILAVGESMAAFIEEGIVS